MPRIRRYAPWLLAAIALAVALAPHVPRDIFTPTRVAIALAILIAAILLLTILALLRRRHARPQPPPDPHALTAHHARRALERSLAAARHALGGDPARTWLLLGPPRHGKSTLAATLLSDLQDVTAPDSPLRTRIARDTRTLVLEHPSAPCDLRPLLKQLRRPLDAILLVVSVPDLATLDLQPLRTRLRDLHDTLEITVPIHLVCTHLDRLAGHHELVGDDASPWGLAIASPEHLPAALRTWSRWVDAQRLARLAGEPSPERRARLFTFAAAFAAACERLADFTTLFTQPTTPPLSLRTVFFTATRRDAAPTDRVLHQLATQLHLPPPHEAPPAHAPRDLVPQPALLTAFLAHDREAARTEAHQRRRARRTHAVAAVLALVAAVLATTAPAAATRERTCLQDLADLTAPLVDPTADPTTTHAHLTALHALRARLAAPACADPPALISSYRRAVRRHLLRDIHTSLETTLTRLATHPPVTVPAQISAREALRTYLLLTADLTEAPGPFDPAQKDWLTADLPRRSRPATEPLLTTFLAHATLTDLSFERDTALVSQVRAQLSAHGDDDATLHAALAAADTACEPLALRALTHAANLVADRTLPCSFTRPGWDLVQQQLASAVDQHDHWILGRPQEPREQRLARLQGRYDARYIQAWTDFLAAVRVRRPTDQASAARLLAELTAEDHPLTRLFTGLAQHTRGLGRTRANLPSWLPTPPDSPPAEIHRVFAPLLAFTVASDREPGLARYHARLAEVLAALEAARSDPAALPALRTQIASALADTQTLLRHADIRRFRPLLTALLLPPLEALQASVTDQDKLALLRTYCHELHAPLRHLATRYPFDPTAADDATLADFTALFHPETGALARLRDGDLAPYLTGHQDDLAAKPTARSDPHPLSPRVVALLRRASSLASLTFPRGQLGLDLTVDLRCNADISRVTLIIGKSRHSYTCGPDPRATLHWPAPPDDDKNSISPEGANLELLGRDGRRQQLPGHGPWGLFRLLEKDGVVTPPTDPSHDPLVFRFDLRASRLGTLDVALTPARTAGATFLFGPTDSAPALLAPLRRRELLSPPDTLFHGLPGCPDLDP